MAEIIDASSQERIFYLPDFIYFVSTVPSRQTDAVDKFVRRILELLILFDRILIPAEHINISSIKGQMDFKTKFLHHSTIQELIENKRIITTIWSACSDIREHLEATERYKRTVAAVSMTSAAITSELLKIEVFKRNQAKQSQSALEFAKANGWIYAGSTELLSYSDGNIYIPFSHESLLIGKGRVFNDPDSILAAKLAYINAMPSGNGGIYRSLVSDIELNQGESSELGEDRLPPAFFTKENHRAILTATGLNVPFHLSAIRNKEWVPRFLQITSSSDCSRYKNVVFKALEQLAERVVISNDKDAKEKLKLIQFVRPLDFGQVGAKVFNPYAFSILLLQEFSKLYSGTHREYIELIPDRPVRKLNHLAASLRCR